jgi:signal transduction histidine kinase
VYLRIQAAQRRTRELAHLVKLRTKEIDQRRQVAEGLREILIRINSNMTLEDSLSFIADQICQIMNVRDVVIAQCDAQRDKKRKLLISSSQNTDIECDLINLIFQRIQDIEKQSKSPEDIIQTIQALEIGFRTPAKTITCLPVYIEGQIEAILVLFSQNSRNWSTEERELLTSFAEQIALALGNAKLRNNTAELAMLNERNRLARDLHDAVTQTLFSASLLAEAFPGVWEKNPTEGKKLIQEMRQLTRGALAEMRSMLMELRPASMAEAKLSDLIRQLAEAVSGRTGLKIDLSVPGDLQLPSDVNVTLYRIAQEALTNVVKHAKAENVKINCSKKEKLSAEEPSFQMIRMVIEDDGCGFEIKKIAQDHFGLYNMQERADSIDADLEITSIPGSGTKISVTWKGEESATNDK